MKLLPKELEKQLPPLYSTQDIEDPIAQVKFFSPTSSWTWYITEYNPEDRLFYGLVYGQEREWGYISLDELESVKGPFGIGIERDLHFKPCPISKCQDPCGIN